MPAEGLAAVMQLPLCHPSGRLMHVECIAGMAAHGERGDMAGRDDQGRLFKGNTSGAAGGRVALPG